MANPFGDDVVDAGANPFGDSVASGNPFGDAPAEGPGVLDTLKSLPERAVLGTVSGVTTSKAAFDWASQQVDPDQLETYERFPESPAAKAYFERRREFEQSKRTADIMKGELKAARPAGAEDSTFDQIVGGTAESLGGSVIPAVGLGVINPALGLAAGLSSNFALEAGGQWEEAQAKGATDEQTGRSMGFGGAVSTILEAGPLMYVKKIMESGGKATLKSVAKAGATVMVSEAAQEGLTQGAMDTEANLSGWGNYGIGEMGKRAGMAAAQGALMGGVMGGSGKLLSKARDENLAVVRERALAESMTEQLIEAGVVLPGEAESTQDMLGRITRDYRTREVNPELAAIQAAQMRGDSADVPATAFGQRIAALLDSRFPQEARTGATLDEEAADYGGITPSVEGRRGYYELEGLAGRDVPLAKRTIMFQSNPEAVGLRLDQISDLPLGSVTVLGGNLQSQEALFPGAMPELIGEVLTKWGQITGIQMPIIVTMEQLQGGQSGGHFTLPLDDKGELFAHVINPRELPSFKYAGGNATTQVEFVSTLSHEYGHALRVENFDRGIVRKAAAQGMSEDQIRGLRAGLRQEINDFALTPERIASIRAFAPIEADLIQRWWDLQTAARAGTISGKDFVNAWYGTRKLSLSAQGEKQTKSLYAWVEREARNRGITTASIDNMTIKNVLDAVSPNDENYVLNFDEFMAEQMSRAAQDRNYLKGTRMGEWFQSALNAVREFFSTIKDQGYVKPDVTFERWLDEQTALAKKTKRPKKWGQVKLGKELKAKQKAQLAALEAERAALRESGEMATEAELVPEEDYEESPLPDDEVAATPEERKASTEAMVQDLVDEGIIEEGKKDHKALKGMITKGQFTEAQEKIWSLRGINWDKGNITTKLISRLPEKEMLKRATVEGIAKQLDLTKLDRQAAEEILAQYPEGNIPREAVVAAVLDRNVPLTMRQTDDYAEYGLENAGILPQDWWRASYTGVNKPIPVTHVWQAPFAVGKENHFSDPQYVAHTRVVTKGNIAMLVELQSDYFQKQSKTDLERKAENARKYLIAREHDVELLQKTLEQYQIEDAVSNAEKTQIAIERALLRVKEAEISYQQYSRMAQGLPASPEHEALDASMQRDDWWKRVIKEEIALQARNGRGEFRVADADTIARIEGWRTVTTLPKELLEKFNAMLVDSYSKDNYPEHMRLTLLGQFNFKGPTDSLYFWTYSPNLGNGITHLTKLPTDVSLEILGYMEQLKNIPRNYGDMQGIYDRYAKTIPKWLQKEYGAVHITTEDQRSTLGEFDRVTIDNQGLLERQDNGWWAFSIPEAAKTVVAWDKGNPAAPTNPEITADYLAGLTLEEMRQPEMVEQAITMWQAQGFKSPFFQRWWKGGKLTDVHTGEPLLVFHGSGAVVEFFDITLAKQERAFFFSDSPLNANFYGKQIWRDTTFFKQADDARKAQTLRIKIGFLGKMLDDMKAGLPVKSPRGVEIKPDAYKVRVQYMRLKGELTKLQDTAETLPTKGVTTGFYVRMENPFEIDFENQEWVHGAYDAIIQQAKTLGHDGIVVKNVYDPSLGTVYMVFSPEQIKDAYRQKGPFEESDRVAWDKGNPEQSALSHLVSGIQGLHPETLARKAVNGWHRTMDALVQLQQRASKPLSNGELDIPMQQMLQDLQKGEAYKNSLQQPGEVLTKELQTRSVKELDAMFNFLEEEARSGVSWFNLQGWSAKPEVPGRELIWGELEDGGQDVSAKTGKLVESWEYVPRKGIEAALAKHGIDATTIRGQEILQLIMQYKTTIIEQMTALERTLQKKIAQRNRNSPEMAIKQIEDLYQTMQKIRLTPFFPQGRYGNYSIIVQEKKLQTKPGERKYRTVRVEYFEHQGDMEVALKQWHAKANATGGKMKVKWHKAEDYNGIPLTLPRNLIEQLENTNLFTREQLEVMSDMMLPAGHEKLANRFGKISDTMAGGEKDLIRNYSNFIWHNANFIWKLEFRSEFTKRINAQKALLRRAQALQTPEGLALSKELQRNTDMMNRVKEYVLYPPYELQGLRTAATLVFLAYNAKTALMNFGTMLNSYAAITTEYGEVQGHKMFAKGLFDAAKLFGARFTGFAKNPKTNHIIGGITPENSPLVWMYNRAVTEGIIDQSYAYFLAGQANGSSALRGVRRGPLGNMARVAMEVGMFPFRMVEKMNRLSTLTMFFEAERGRGSSLEAAYTAAVQRTNLLQNAYDAGNRSELFRGKKAILTMFASYTQFMTWNMMGGYSKALSADLKARGLDKAQLGGSAYTMKLWFIYMMLGGLLAPPFMENLMEVLSFIYRKMFGGNLRLETRKFVADLGASPDLVMHGMLGNFAGMDLSGSFSLGRILPGVDMLNRDYKNFAEWAGSFATKSAGAFGGFTEDLVKFVSASWEVAHGQGRVGEALKELPGAIGAIGKAVDAYILQSMQPTYGVLDKSGARLVEDPPGSQNFRDLTNWELVGMAAGGNPTVLARKREMDFMEVSEQIYWRTRQQTLLDARWKAVRTGDGEMLGAVDAKIDQFNKNLPKGYEGIRISGKTKADSIKTHRRTVRNKEADKTSRKFRGVQSNVEAGFTR